MTEDWRFQLPKALFFDNGSIYTSYHHPRDPAS